MEDFDIVAGIAILVGAVMFLIGVSIAIPKKLDNGCIVYDSKVYCEKESE